jgi:hypothetical protein
MLDGVVDAIDKEHPIAFLPVAGRVYQVAVLARLGDGLHQFDRHEMVHRLARLAHGTAREHYPYAGRVAGHDLIRTVAVSVHLFRQLLSEEVLLCLRDLIECGFEFLTVALSYQTLLVAKNKFDHPVPESKAKLLRLAAVI